MRIFNLSFAARCWCTAGGSLLNGEVAAGRFAASAAAGVTSAGFVLHSVAGGLVIVAVGGGGGGGGGDVGSAVSV